MHGVSKRVSSMELTTTQPTDEQNPVYTGHFSGQNPVPPQGMASMEQTNTQSHVDSVQTNAQSCIDPVAWADYPEDDHSQDSERLLRIDYAKQKAKRCEAEATHP